MKRVILLLTILYFFITTAIHAHETILNHVLNDSVVAKYMAEYCVIDANEFVLFEREGNFLYNHGEIEWVEHKCENKLHYSGIVRKIKMQERKASIRIYFTGDHPFYVRVRLSKDASNQPWKIKSRMITRPFRFPRNHPWLIHYSTK